MNSRQRFEATLAHEQPDRVCVDFGSTLVTGMAVSTVDRLRKALLKDPDYRVKVTEPYQMLGEIDEELAEALGVDISGVLPPGTLFGFENKDWKPFTLFDGTEVLAPGDFNVTPDGQGGWFIHPEGDTTAPPSGHMPKNGFYFDSICRQEPVDEDHLNPADNLEEFGPVSEEVLESLDKQARQAETWNKGAIVSLPGTGFGDIALVPAPWMKRTKGIRDVQEWYISTAVRKDYVHAVFEQQCELALRNIDRIADRLGDRVQAAFLTGTDFGTQNGLFISKKAYRELYFPYQKRLNDHIHRRTNWKTFIHSCGAVFELIPDFIEAGFDILNPVQCSAHGMDPVQLKKHFGRDLIFWGGGVDTQKTLPFGAADDVYREVRQRIDIFNQDGGFVFNGIHNIQSGVPVENLLAMFRAIKDSTRG